MIHYFPCTKSGKLITLNKEAWLHVEIEPTNLPQIYPKYLLKQDIKKCYWEAKSHLHFSRVIDNDNKWVIMKLNIRNRFSPKTFNHRFSHLNSECTLSKILFPQMKYCDTQLSCGFLLSQWGFLLNNIVCF